MKRDRTSRPFKNDTFNQARRVKLLQLWLDLAALVDFDNELPPPWNAEKELVERVFEQGAAPKPLGDGPELQATLKIGSAFFPFGVIFDRVQGARDFYEFFWTVRRALEWMIDTWAARDRWVDGFGLKGKSPLSSFPIPAAQGISMSRSSGSIFFSEDKPIWWAFRQAVDGLELERLRRCPVCRRIYYAWRKNKGACDEHLALARVWRKRGKLSEYKANRRFRKKANLKGLRGKDRQDVLSLSKALQSRRRP
jgi:hypothetical protein